MTTKKALKEEKHTIKKSQAEKPRFVRFIIPTDATDEELQKIVDQLKGNLTEEALENFTYDVGEYNPEHDDYLCKCSFTYLGRTAECSGYWSSEVVADKPRLEKAIKYWALQ
jgi:hypothetical protein